MDEFEAAHGVVREPMPDADPLDAIYTPLPCAVGSKQTLP